MLKIHSYMVTSFTTMTRKRNYHVSTHYNSRNIMPTVKLKIPIQRLFMMNLGHSLTPDMAPCTTTTILPVQVKYGNDKSTATKNENRCSNSVFQCLTKMKVRIPFFNEGGKRKTKMEVRIPFSHVE